ncbi:trimeric intracellular cation channel family protein [Actinomadura chibensis]|uniref:Trimeric intracellular cation channel family protein n=1 Tax=Actinomadura chibensis TaxID=392828 RepID=A0A5D0NBD7_9ACTN|nr:TRIC cation channel family protein [Actinomadura chibensis]TYB41495.1 trimeric intracellular cation channel family protein [Actinomadura chibensis]
MSGPGVAAALDLAGIFVFAVSGALAAVRQRLDIVGMVVLAEITALGGGIVRDLMIGAVPPAAFTDLGYVLVPLAASALVFFWHPQVTRLFPAVLLFDAAGLGLFCTTGTLKALDHGLSPVHAVLLGVVTAVGGGVLRDVLAGHIPSVLYDRQLYALPALLGAAAVAAADAAGLHGGAVTTGAAVMAFAMRVLAMRYGWRAPLPRGVPD